MSTSLDANSKPVDAQVGTPVAQDAAPAGAGGLSTLTWIIIGGILAVLLAIILVWRFRPPEFHGVLIQSPDAAADFTISSPRPEREVTSASAKEAGR